MGAWGEGMQANDTAWDAIGDAGFDVNGHVPKKTVQELNRDPKKVAKYFKGWKGEPWGILGLAEYLLDSGVDLSDVRKTVKEAIDEELGESASHWRDPEVRKQTLRLFRDRLAGKAVDMKEVENSNRGLLERVLEGRPPKRS